jgi:hypothetical protein
MIPVRSLIPIPDMTPLQNSYVDETARSETSKSLLCAPAILQAGRSHSKLEEGRTPVIDPMILSGRVAMALLLTSSSSSSNGAVLPLHSKRT